MKAKELERFYEKMADAIMAPLRESLDILEENEGLREKISAMEEKISNGAVDNKVVDKRPSNISKLFAECPENCDFSNWVNFMVSTYKVNHGEKGKDIVEITLSEMRKNYGFIPSLESKEYNRRHEKRGRAPMLEVISENELWKDIFSSILVNIIHNDNPTSTLIREMVPTPMVEDFDYISQSRIDVDSIRRLAEKRDDKSGKNKDTINLIFDVMLPTSKWKEVSIKYMEAHPDCIRPKKEMIVKEMGLIPAFNRTVQTLLNC